MPDGEFSCPGRQHGTLPWLFEGGGKITDVTLYPLSFQVQVVGLGRGQHLISVVYILLPLSHLFWQLGEQPPMFVVSVFCELGLGVFPLHILLGAENVSGGVVEGVVFEAFVAKVVTSSVVGRRLASVDGLFSFLLGFLVDED